MKRGLLLALVVACGCGGQHARFPVRDVVWKDTDTTPVSVPCQKRPSKEDPNHVACAPEVYISSNAWDLIDNSLFRPFARVWAVDPPKEARNVNAFDEVPDSSWFTNRLGKKKPPLEELARGACKPDDILDGDALGEDVVIDQGKPNGASPGFRVKIGAKKKYMFKTDFEKEPERPSAAAVLGTIIYYAVGFNTSCEQVAYADASKFKLKPGLTVTANDGVTRPFDQKALATLLAKAVKAPDGKVRFQASAWLKGYLLGPFKYEGTRSDDPNDIIDHEDRRDLRGGRLVAAWLHHIDAREQNSMDAWIAANPSVPDSSPGYVKHHYLDTSDCFGSLWDWERVSRELGHSYLIDWGHMGADFVTFGILERPWEREHVNPAHPMFGYYGVEEFDPDGWLNEYPNPAFGRATEHDNAWMARILSRFDKEDIKAIVARAKFSDPGNAEYLADVMDRRLQKIVERYLLRLSPIADLRIEDNLLCGVDLARRRSARPENEFRYAATANGAPLAVTPKPGGELCVALPPPSAYTVVSITNGASRGRLDAHLANGKLVGLERPDP